LGSPLGEKGSLDYDVGFVCLQIHMNFDMIIYRQQAPFLASLPGNNEGPIWRNREGGSEWEPIKILLEGDENSNKMNTASNTRLRLTTQVGQIHVATGVLLNLGTNFQPYRPENAAEHQTSSPLTNTDQTCEHRRSDQSLLVRLGNFHKKAPHRSGRCDTTVRPVTARKPQNTKQAYRAPN
jgi:hypothetical protein